MYVGTSNLIFFTKSCKGKAPVVPFHGITLRNTASLKKFEFVCPFNKALRKLKKSCFASHQLYIELKTKSWFTTLAIFAFQIQVLTTNLIYPGIWKMEPWQ